VHLAQCFSLVRDDAPLPTSLVRSSRVRKLCRWLFLMEVQGSLRRADGRGCRGVRCLSEAASQRPSKKEKFLQNTSSRGCGCKFAGRYFRVFYRKMHYFIPPYRILLPNMGKKHTYSQHSLGHQPLPFYFPFPFPCLLHLKCVVGLCIFISSHGRWFVVLAYLTYLLTPAYSFSIAP